VATVDENNNDGGDTDWDDGGSDSIVRGVQGTKRQDKRVKTYCI